MSAAPTLSAERIAELQKLAEAAENPALNGGLNEPLNAARKVISVEYTSGEHRTLHFYAGEFMHWEGGAYQPISTTAVSAAVYSVLEANGQRPTRRSVGDTIHALQALALLSDRVQVPSWLSNDLPAGEFVACGNGILNVASGELLAPTPEFFTRSALPVCYDPNANEPDAWIKFVRQLWPEDPESVATLQEFIGYLLTADTSQQKILLIVGPKRAGKGTILRVLTELLGRENIAAPTLGSLALPFGLQSLIGKLAAFISDARLSGRADASAIAERLLAISGEDHVAVPRKFLGDYTAQITARFILATNELPRLNDVSGALASRFIVLVLRESFFGREDPTLSARLTTELPGILKWAIAGRQRLAQRGRFLQPKSATDAVEALDELGSPIGAFLKDECTVGPGAAVSCADLFSAWQGWCLRSGREHGGNIQSFSRDLRAAVPGLKSTQPRIESTQSGVERKRVRKFEGVGLARGGTRSNPLHPPYIDPSRETAIEMHACHRVPSCPRCRGEGCNWCRHD